MASIAELMLKYEECLKAEEALKKAEQEAVEAKAVCDQMDAEIYALEREIWDIKEAIAKNIYSSLDQDRFTVVIERGTRTVQVGQNEDREEQYSLSNAHLNVLGLSIPIGYTETFGEKSKVLMRLFSDQRLMKKRAEDLLKKITLDPEGAKTAFIAPVKKQIEREKVELSIRIQSCEKSIDKKLSEIARLEKIMNEEIPDNAITRKIFKKKFELKEKAPEMIKNLKEQVESLKSRINLMKNKLEVYSTLDSDDKIRAYMDTEIEYLRNFVESDFEGPFIEGVGGRIAQIKDLRKKRYEKAERISTYLEERDLYQAKNVFENKLKELERMFDSKEFVEEFRAIVPDKLTPEQRVVYDRLKEVYNRHFESTLKAYGYEEN